ncbi:hypothetical protein BJ741DRAFT_697792 [Chytriomyces cf. hyalinus JEL632]|nr:hypothetical protein BJ741DRAFT_697792 [Chytriomyces cf. hyalinus JEL632]
MSTLLDTCRTLTIALSSANADARFNRIPDQCNQAVMNAVINLSNSCQSSEAFPFALSNALPATLGLGSPNYSNPTTMQAFCQTTYGIALSVDGSVVAPPPTSAATTTGTLTTSGTASLTLTSTASRTLTSTAAQSQPADTGGSGGGFMFPSSTGNSFAFPTSSVAAGGSQNSNNGGSGAAQGMSGGAIAGIIVGVLVLLGLVGGLVYWFRSKKDTSDRERLDVGPLPPTSQFSSSNPAYHSSKSEPPNMAAYHFQQPQQQPLPSSARSDHLMYNMPANNAYTPTSGTSDTLQDQQAPPIPNKQTPAKVIDTALNSAFTSYAQTSGVPARSPATYDAAIASVAPKSLQTTNPEDWSVEQCAYWAREIPEFGTAVSWQILNKRVSGRTLLTLTRQEMQSELGLAFGEAATFETSISKLFGRDSSGMDAPPVYFESAGQKSNAVERDRWQQLLYSSILLNTISSRERVNSSASGDARFSGVPDNCTQAVMNAVINLSNSCQSSAEFPFALSNSLPARAGLGSPNYSDPATMQAFCQNTHGIALNVDGVVVAPPPPSVAPTTRVVTTTGIVGTTSSASTSSRTLTSTAAPSPPAATTGGGGDGFMFPSTTGNSFAFPTAPAAGASQNSNNGGSGAAQGMSRGAIAGIIVGVLVLLGLVGGLVYWFHSKKDTSDRERLDVGPLPPTSQFSSSNPAYHSSKSEPPNMAAYHYQQPEQQQDLRGRV